MISSLWWILIAGDLLLMAAVVALWLRLRSVGDLPKVASPRDLEQFISEAQKLTQEFDRLLGEKRQLVRTTLATLDERIAQLNQMRQEAEKSLETAARIQPQAPLGSDGMDQFRRQVLELARKGRQPAQIAQATGRPRGEVELVLGLSNQGS